MDVDGHDVHVLRASIRLRTKSEVQAVVTGTDQGDGQEGGSRKLHSIADNSVRGRTNDQTRLTHGGAPVTSRAESSFSEGNGEVRCEQ